MVGGIISVSGCIVIGQASEPGCVPVCCDRPRILLAEEHTLFTDALRKLLESEFDIVGSVANGLHLLQQAPRLRPDVVLLA